MAQKMTEEEWRAFVSHGTRTGKLSTVRADGSPHIAPIWFLLDGDDFVFNTGKDTVKGRNLARDGRVALCVDDDRPPFAFVVLQGRAELAEDLGRGAALGDPDRRPLHGRGARRGVRRAQRRPGELLVRVTIDKVLAQPASRTDRPGPWAPARLDPRRPSAHRVEQPGGVHPPGVLDQPDQHLLPRVPVPRVAQHHRAFPGPGRGRGRRRGHRTCRAPAKQLTATTNGMRRCSK